MMWLGGIHALHSGCTPRFPKELTFVICPHFLCSVEVWVTSLATALPLAGLAEAASGEVAVAAAVAASGEEEDAAEEAMPASHAARLAALHPLEFPALELSFPLLDHHLLPL